MGSTQRCSDEGEYEGNSSVVFWGKGDGVKVQRARALIPGGAEGKQGCEETGWILV